MPDYPHSGELDPMIGDEILRNAKAERNEAREARKQSREERGLFSRSLPMFPRIPVILVFVNLVLVALDTLTCFKLSPGGAYYVVSSTVGSLTLIGFFVRGVYTNSYFYR